MQKGTLTDHTGMVDAHSASQVPDMHASSSSEEQRTSTAVSTLVGDFHDRFWLPRDAAGDAAAASAASVAALSSDPGQRSVAAHLYAVRTTQRLVKQVLATVRHRAPNEPAFGVDANFGCEMETAIGAAVHAELCRVFDEVSRVNAVLCAKHAAMPDPSRGAGYIAGPSAPAAAPGQAPSTSAKKSANPTPAHAPAARTLPKEPIGADEALEDAGQHIYMLQKQVDSLERQLEAALKDRGRGTRGGGE